MSRIRKILWPTDFSDCSDWALEHAVSMARWYAADLIALHVAPPRLMNESGKPLAFADMEPLEPGVREEIVQSMRYNLRLADEAGVRHMVEVIEGRPVDVILEQAALQNADLIVMGSHGRRGIERLMLGSVAERVLRRARCGVMTVPRRSEEPAAPGHLPFRRLLCPVDFSSVSMKALEFAVAMAEESDAKIILLNVVEWLPEWEPVERGRFDTARFAGYLEARSIERLKSAVPEDARDWCRPEELVVRGRPYREILRVAAEKGVDLIVMGVQGRGAIDMMMFGSTASQVVRSAGCPVLTIRGEPR